MTNTITQLCAPQTLRSACAAESSLSAPGVANLRNHCFFTWSAKTDQTVRMRRLILDFTGHTCHFVCSAVLRLIPLSHRRPAKAQASLRIRAVSPQPSLFAYIKYGSGRRVGSKIRHLAPLDGCACAFEE